MQTTTRDEKDTLYDVTLIIDKSGEIVTTACGCSADVGPMASCKHICALCYALEEFTALRILRSPQSHHNCNDGINRERENWTHV